jgi:glycosyltransferase involved in cell wall biosynthesis
VISLGFAVSVLFTTFTARAVVIHGIREPNAAWAAFCAVLARKPFVVLAHGMLTGALSSPSAYTRCCLWLCIRAKRVYALTAEEQQALQRRLGADRVSVLPNAVPPSETSGHAKKYDIAIVSRLHPRKGVGLACDVVRELLGRAPSLRAAIAGPDEGDAEPVNSLVAEFAESVEYLGPLSPPAARRCIAEARILLAVALEEPYGLTVVEAFREGTAVVIGAGGYSLQDSWLAEGAVVSVPREACALADAVGELLLDPGRLAQTIEAGRRWASHHAGVATMADTIRSDLAA